jgi:hypothetical protein
MTNDVQRTLISQVSELVFLKKGQVFLVDDDTVRFHVGKRLNIDVSYDHGLDLYTVTTHKAKPDYTVTTDVVAGVYAEDLGSFFPKRLVKDANVRAFIAQIQEARAARAAA